MHGEGFIRVISRNGWIFPVKSKAVYGGPNGVPYPASSRRGQVLRRRRIFHWGSWIDGWCWLGELLQQFPRLSLGADWPASSGKLRRRGWLAFRLGGRCRCHSGRGHLDVGNLSESVSKKIGLKADTIPQCLSQQSWSILLVLLEVSLASSFFESRRRFRRSSPAGRVRAAQRGRNHMPFDVYEAPGCSRSDADMEGYSKP